MSRRRRSHHRSRMRKSIKRRKLRRFGLKLKRRKSRRRYRVSRGGVRLS